jgi:hypothetical protein
MAHNCAGTTTEPFNLTWSDGVCGCSIGGFYAGPPGGPVFSKNADVLTLSQLQLQWISVRKLPRRDLRGLHSAQSDARTGHFVDLGSGVLGLAGVIRKKLRLTTPLISSVCRKGQR